MHGTQQRVLLKTYCVAANTGAVKGALVTEYDGGDEGPSGTAWGHGKALSKEKLKDK